MSNPITFVWLFKNSIQFDIDNNNNNQTTMIKLGPITPSYPTQSLLDDHLKKKTKNKKLNGYDQIRSTLDNQIKSTQPF
jgi:hypothetical protein